MQKKWIAIVIIFTVFERMVQVGFSRFLKRRKFSEKTGVNVYKNLKMWFPKKTKKWTYIFSNICKDYCKYLALSYKL